MPTIKLIALVLLSGVLCVPSLYAHVMTEPGSKEVSAYFKTLRENYAKAQPGAIAWETEKERKNVLALFDKATPEKFLDAALHWLEKCPVDARIYLMTADAYARMGNDADNIRHRNMYFGLLTSIVNSGDGRSAGTAFKVIAPEEEYNLIIYMNAELKHQRLEGVYDVLEVVIRGQPTTLYFDVSTHLQGIQRELDAVKR
jgi:Domain of unknown function (DUF4919)